MKHVLLAMALSTGGAAVAQTSSEALQYSGDWTAGDASACMVFSDHANFAYRITDGVLLGLESGCEMLNPVAVRDMSAVLFDMQCTGEGDTWAYRALFLLNGPDELVYVRDQYTQILTRCTNTSAPAASVETK